MTSKLYVGNLPFSVTEEQLEEMFKPYGAVQSAKVITDRATGRSRGFGFVEFENADQANAAVEELDGKDQGGRNLKVNPAKEQEPRDRRPRGGDRGNFRSDRY